VQGAVSRNFNDGSRDVTGVTSNLAIEGDGFFILKDSSGQTYTRDGTFKLNALNELVNASGFRVQGFGVDDNNNIIPGILKDIDIPLGALTIADATTAMTMGGNLNANGSLPSAVTHLALNQEFYTSDGSGGVTGTAPTSSTALTLLTDASGNAYFKDQDILTLTGTSGKRSIASKTLTVGPGTTLADLMSFMNGTLGINTSTGANGNITTTPGTSLASGSVAASAKLTVDGNLGSANDLDLDYSSLTISRSGASTSPFSWDKQPSASADGISYATSATVFDSLGTPVLLNVVASLVSRDNTGTTWRYYATSPDSALTQSVVGTGTLNFDSNGRLVTATNTTINIDRSGTGAAPNLPITLDFTKMSAFTNDQSSAIYASPTDGQRMGTLNDYSIDESGIIKGSFDNGATRTLGQVALATFRNNQGLIDLGNNAFQEGPNSGTAVISAPGELAAGKIISGALELSNVDLSSEFVQLISASTGFSANSRVITTSNQLMQELLSAAR
jgi:flagellar hook protein FlgE